MVTLWITFARFHPAAVFEEDRWRRSEGDAMRFGERM